MIVVMVKLRFAHLVFGLHRSPAILGSFISHHLNKYQCQIPGVNQSIKVSFYIDDLISGGATVEEALNMYSVVKRVMAMNLQKWNSNSQELISKVIQAESGSSVDVAAHGEGNQLTVGNSDPHSKLVGVGWDSFSDELNFNFSALVDQVSRLLQSRRSLLKATASIFVSWVYLVLLWLD